MRNPLGEGDGPHDEPAYGTHLRSIAHAVTHHATSPVAVVAHDRGPPHRQESPMTTTLPETAEVLP